VLVRCSAFSQGMLVICLYGTASSIRKETISEQNTVSREAHSEYTRWRLIEGEAVSTIRNSVIRFTTGRANPARTINWYHQTAASRLFDFEPLVSAASSLRIRLNLDLNVDPHAVSAEF